MNGWRSSFFLASLLTLGLTLPASALERRDLPFVQNLAYQLYVSSNRVLVHAQRSAHLFNPWERAMLQSLYTFEVASGRFHSVLHLWFANQQMVAYEWNRMIDHAYRVNQAIYRSNPMRLIVHEWNQCIQLQNQIRWYLVNESHRADFVTVEDPPAMTDSQSAMFESLYGNDDR